MSKTTRNRDFWEMRQLSAALSRADAVGGPFAGGLRRDPVLRDTEDRFHRLWARYGHKSMVMDKRRRVSTRKSNSEYVRELRRSARRAAGQRLRTECALADYDVALWPVRPSRR